MATWNVSHICWDTRQARVCREERQPGPKEDLLPSLPSRRGRSKSDAEVDSQMAVQRDQHAPVKPQTRARAAYRGVDPVVLSCLLEMAMHLALFARRQSKEEEIIQYRHFSTR